MRTTIARVFFGLLVILLGVGLLGQALGWWLFIGFEGWWTMFLIIPAVFMIIAYGLRFWNVLLLCVGTLLLLKEQQIITQGMVGPIILAGLIILLGLRIAFGNRFQTVKPVSGFSTMPPIHSGQADTSSNPEYNIVFGSIKVKNVSPNFTGAKVSAVFSYAEIDLTEIVIARDVIIETSAAFGGIRIYAPRNYRLKVECSSAFGGCDNRAAVPTDPTLPLVTIKASTAFGGTEIR